MGLVAHLVIPALPLPAALVLGARWKHRRLGMLMTEREVLLAARDAHEIDDEVFRRVQRELDLEEAALTRE